MRCLIPALVLGVLPVAGPAFGRTLPEPKSGLTLRRLYSYPLVHGRSPAAPAMSPDGRKIVFAWNQTGERRRDVWVMDYPSGTKKQILASDSIARFPRQDDSRTELQKQEELIYDDGLSGFQWSPDSREIMTGSYRGRIWLMNPDGTNLRPLSDSQEQFSNATYSPDGKWIGFIRGANLFRMDRKSGQIKQLTFVSKPGTGIDGYNWAPDGKTVAVSWSDNSRMGRHVMMDFTKDRAEVVPISRMWNGDMSWNAQMGLIPIDGGLVTFVPDIPRYMWMTTWDWSPDGDWFSFGWISQDFQTYTITSVSRDGKRKLRTYEEKAPSQYIPDFRTLRWSQDGKEILFTTDIRDGKWMNRSLLATDVYGDKIRPVYAENHDIAGFMRPKNSDRLVLITQSRGGQLAEITILDPGKTPARHEVFPEGMASPVEFDDCAPPLVSDDGQAIATLAGRRGLNPELYGVRPRAERLTESQLPEFKKVAWAKTERITFPGPDGKPIHALLLTDPNLDKSKKHPAVISNMYANSGKHTWAGYIDNYLAMELGFVVIQVDFRGSWGYGGEFNSGYYKSLGVIDAQEAVACKSFLTGLGYVNPERCGVWGWSYGGFLTCMIMFTQPGVFDTGVAVASVTDWTKYNEWYSRRRLGLPADEAEVYKKTSPIHHTAGFKGNLLLVHGMLDDNVLYQDTVQVMEKLIENGKQFDTFAYPRGDHGMWRQHETPHVWEKIVGYLHQQLSRP